MSIVVPLLKRALANDLDEKTLHAIGWTEEDATAAVLADEMRPGMTVNEAQLRAAVAAHSAQ